MWFAFSNPDKGLGVPVMPAVSRESFVVVSSQETKDEDVQHAVKRLKAQPPQSPVDVVNLDPEETPVFALKKERFQAGGDFPSATTGSQGVSKGLAQPQPVHPTSSPAAANVFTLGGVTQEPSGYGPGDGEESGDDPKKPPTASGHSDVLKCLGPNCLRTSKYPRICAA